MRADTPTTPARSMNAQHSTLKAFIDAATDAVGKEIANLRREAQREQQVREAEHRAVMAELRASLSSVAAIELRLNERLETLRDGVDGKDGADGAPGRDGVDGKDGADGLPGRDGVDGKDGADGAPGRDGVDGKDGADGLPGRDGVDGKDGADGAPGRDGVDGKDGADGAPGRDGVDGKDGADVDEISVDQDGGEVKIGFTVGEIRTVFRIELPEGAPGRDGVDGKDGADGLPGRDGVDGKDGERGERGPVGKMAPVAPWSDDVHYEGDIRTHAGGTWQALRDTAKEPPHADWACLSAPGVDGKDGISLNPRGLWAPADTYARNDIVALNGASFVAVRDDPGECPGDGWKLLCQQGKRGQPGDRGPKGDRGDPGERGRDAEPVVAMSHDENGMLTLINGDGSKVECDLYPLLSKIAR